MSNRQQQRDAILERLADHLLLHGVRGASLRPMAVAAGTSDRMLLYYFADKDELLAATLAVVAGRLQQTLNASMGKRRTFDSLLPHLAQFIRAPEVKPFLTLWLELAALAGRDQEPYLTIGRQIADGFLKWISASLEVEKESQRGPIAAFLFATLEGLVLLDAVDSRSTVEAAINGIKLLSKSRKA